VRVELPPRLKVDSTETSWLRARGVVVIKVAEGFEIKSVVTLNKRCSSVPSTR